MILFFTIIMTFEKINVVVEETTLIIGGDGEVTSDLKSQIDTSLITSININDGPESIGDGVFNNFNNIKTIFFNKDIKCVGNSNFMRNYKLEEFIIKKGNPYIWTDGQLLYQDKNTTLVGVVASAKSIFILSTVENIHSTAFSSLVYSKEIIIPKNVQLIRTSTFTEATIEKVSFEKGSKLKCIEKKSFEWSRVYNIVFPPSLEKISSNSFAFSDIKNCSFDLIDFSNLSTIEDSAFDGSKLKYIILPACVSSLPSNCFANSLISNINIPRECSNVSNTAFSGCSFLTSVTVDDGNHYYISVNGSIFNGNLTELIFVPPETESLIIPAELESISQSIIQSLKKLTTINVNESNQIYSSYNGSLYKTNESILEGVCGGVTHLYVHENVVTIMDNAFRGVGINIVTFLGNKLKYIRSYAFYQCVNLTRIELPSSIYSLSKYVFAGTNLQEIIFQKTSNLFSIDGFSFYKVPLRSIEFPASLQHIYYQTFFGITTLESITFEEGSRLSTIGDETFLNCKSPKIIDFVIPKSVNQKPTSTFVSCNFNITFEKGSCLKIIGTSMFSSCTGIIGKFVIPSSVQCISSSAFNNCPNLEEIVFEDGSNIKIVESAAFKNCINLRKIHFPLTLESIDVSTIYGCKSLKDLTIDSNNKNYSAQSNIIYNKQETLLIVCSPGQEIATVLSSVQSIGSNAFYNCNYLKSVSFNSPSGLNTISENTFSGCSNLSSIAFPTALQEIQKGAFKDCGLLLTVTFDSGSNLSIIGNEAFANCQKLSTVLFGSDENLKTIGDKAFEGCSSLRRISLPSSITSIGSGCFSNCNLDEIELSMSLSSIGDLALSHNLIKIISVPGNVQSIGERCFANCEFLAEITIAKSVNYIGSGCFDGCSSLLSLKYCGFEYIKSDCGIRADAIMFVQQGYTESSFCGAIAYRQLDASCNVLPPTASMTGAFTASGIDTVSSRIFFAIVVKDDDLRE